MLECKGYGGGGGKAKTQVEMELTRGIKGTKKSFHSMVAMLEEIQGKWYLSANGEDLLLMGNAEMVKIIPFLLHFYEQDQLSDDEPS